MKQRKWNWMNGKQCKKFIELSCFIKLSRLKYLIKFTIISVITSKLINLCFEQCK